VITKKMTQDSDLYTNNREYESHKISPREILIKYLPFLPWIMAFVLFSLIVAYIKIRYTPETYNVASTILIKDESPYGSNAGKFDDIFLSPEGKVIQDEMQVIRSRSMAKRVVKSLGLEVQYFNEGKIRSTEMRESESPFNLKIISLKDSNSSFSMGVVILSDNKFSLAENGAPIHFDQPFETAAGKFSLARTVVSTSLFSSNRFFASYTPAESRAGDLVGSLSATQSGESNNILKLVFETQNSRLGVDIVNQWMKEYQQAGLEDKKQTAVNALRFINEQLDTVKYDLTGVERNLLGYREKNRVISPEQQTSQIFNVIADLDKDINTQGVRIQVLDNLINYINDTRNPYRQVASNLGLTEPSLLAQIQEFNSLQLQRETLLRTTTRANPMLVDIETGIEKLRIGILQSMKNIKSAEQLAMDNLLQKSKMAGSEVSRIPAKEKQLLDITRRQKILEELYSFLLQKKLETSISSASTISNVKVIEPAMPTGVLVKPNKSSIYSIALFLGLLIPGLIILLAEYLNDKVKSRDDIERSTSSPILGEVGHSEDKASLVVSRVSRKFIAEQFRIIRTNLQYLLPKQEKAVILVTSSSSGEGKSFISTNVGAVMSLAGKRTAIIEFDIRKPKIMSSLNLPKKTGITNYIIGKSSLDDLPVPVPGYENLFVIPCGPIPPNPSELLLDSRLDEMMTRLKQDFDVLIIDTAPVGLVSDTIMLGKYADVSLYVVRHNYTFKKQLKLLNEIYTNKRLPKLSVVINDIKAQGAYGRYYGYGGYGYTGYGYGYGGEYFDDAKKSGGVRNRIAELLNGRK